MKPDVEFIEHLRAGRFMLQKSRSTGRVYFYPRIMAPGTGAEDLDWVEASGKGVVYSTSVMRVRPPLPSYNIALIDLAEGPRLMSRVEGLAPEEVRIGMTVKARIDPGEDHPIVVFIPD